MENQLLLSKHFFLENKTRKTNVVKLHLISGEPVAINVLPFSNYTTFKSKTMKR
jgi:hypothetical protein